MAENIDKRPHFFTGQFLDEDDFNAAQDYFLDRERRHQRLLHNYGIADGLEVKVGGSTVQVEPGTAIDSQGRQIVLFDSQTLALPKNLKDKVLLVVISYFEVLSDQEGKGFARWHESPKVEIVQEADKTFSADTYLRLARIDLTESNPQLDTSVRSYAGVRLGTEVDVRKLRLQNDQVTADSWPALTCGAADRVDVTGGLRIGGDLQVSKLSLKGQGVAEASWPALTCSAENRVDVAGGLRVSGDLQVGGALTLGSGAKPLLVVGKDGRAGIGTADPKGTLEVNSGAVNASPTLGVSTPNAEDFFAIYGARQDSQNNDLLWKRGPLRFGTATTFGGVGFSEKMRITADGNVGIGIAEPLTCRLTIRQGTGPQGGGLRVFNNSATNSLHLWVMADSAVLEALGQTSLILRANGQDRLSFAAGTNVTKATGDLVLDSGQPAAAGLLWAAQNKSSWQARNNATTGTLDFSTSPGGTAALTLHPGGNLGIGAPAPAERLHVAGSARIEGALSLQGSDGTFRGSLDLGREPGSSASWRITHHANQTLLILRRDPPQSKGPYLILEPDGTIRLGVKTPGTAVYVVGASILSQEAWKPVTPQMFMNGWVNSGGWSTPAGYMKDSLGFVHLRGIVKGGTGPLIFTLPEGYKAPYTVICVVATNNLIAGRVTVDLTGNVSMTSGDNGYLSLDGITFQAGFTSSVADFGPIDSARYNPTFGGTLAPPPSP